MRCWPSSALPRLLAAAVAPSRMLRSAPPRAAIEWDLPPSWAMALRAERQPYFEGLRAFVNAERASTSVLPPAEQQFAAFEACAFEDVRVVILGQDPYPTPGHAHGLAFSVPPHVRPVPGSLRNIYQELERDLGVPRAPHGEYASSMSNWRPLVHTP